MRDADFMRDAMSRAKRKPVRVKIHPLGLSIYLGLAIFAAAEAAAEPPRTIDDCEKIQAADAYNQCLASFGPVAHEHGKPADPENGGGGPPQTSSAHMPSTVADVPPQAASHGRSHGYRHQSYHRTYRHWTHTRHSRQHAEFKVR